MKNLIQKYFMAMVAVMMVVGFSAFKIVENNKTDDPEIDWYEVGPRDGFPNIFEVKGLFSGDPIEGTDPEGCATENEGIICALQLEVGPMAPSLIGEDISTLSSLPDVEEKDSAFHPED